MIFFDDTGSGAMYGNVTRFFRHTKRLHKVQIINNKNNTMPSLGEHSASARIGQKPPRGTLIQDALPAYLMGPRRVIKNYKLPSKQLSLK